MHRLIKTYSPHLLFSSQIRIPASVAPHFALFESLDPRFDRKLGPDEVPHAIYVANYSTAAATCILLKKWVFSLKLESALMSSGTISIAYDFSITSILHRQNYNNKTKQKQHYNNKTTKQQLNKNKKQNKEKHQQNSNNTKTKQQ